MNDYFPELDGNQSIDNGKMGRKLFKGGGGGQQQTTTSEIDPMLKPYISYGLDEAKTLYQAGAPEYYPGQTYVDPSAATTSGLEAAQARATAGNPLIPQAQNTISGLQSAVNPALSSYQTLQGGGTNLALPGTQTTASGNYLSAGNPYFASMMSSAAAPVISEYEKATQNLNSTAAQSGRYGSGAQAQMQSDATSNLADALSRQAGQLAYQNYGQERGLQESAIGRLGNISNTQFSNQLAAAQGLGNLSETQAQRQMSAASAAPQLAQADYGDIQQLMNVGKTQEDYSRQALQGDIDRYQYGVNAPQQQLGSYLSAAYGAPAPINSTTTTSGGGK